MGIKGVDAIGVMGLVETKGSILPATSREGQKLIGHIG